MYETKDMSKEIKIDPHCMNYKTKWTLKYLNKIFNLDIPKSYPGIPSNILDPRKTWKNKKNYDKSAKNLSKMFVENFKKFKEVSQNIKKAGPKE